MLGWENCMRTRSHGEKCQNMNENERFRYYLNLRTLSHTKRQAKTKANSLTTNKKTNCISLAFFDNSSFRPSSFSSLRHRNATSFGRFFSLFISVGRLLSRLWFGSMEFIPAILYTANVCRDKRFIANHGHRKCVNTIDFRLIDLDNIYPFFKIASTIKQQTNSIRNACMFRLKGKSH